MAIDTKIVDSPGWWMDRLARKLVGRQQRLEDLDKRYRGDPPLPEGAQNARDVYKAFQRKARTNFAELVVEATRERMIPVGFLTAAERDPTGDTRARELWEANDLDVESADVHTSMLAMGDGYVIVGKDPDSGEVVITGEDPRQVVTIHDPIHQRKVRAGLKLFHDPEEGKDYAYLYRAGRVHVASQPAKVRAGTNRTVRFSAGWNWDEDRGGADGLELGFDVVPVVRFRNRRGVGEFEPHLDLLDRINHQVLQRMVIATMQAFRQRAVKNMPDEDDEGEKIDYADLFVADPGALWLLPADSDIWESNQVDLTPILSAVKDDVTHLSAVTRTPLATLMPGDGSDTAEGAAFKREGLVFKAEDRMARAGGAWKDVMTLAFLLDGDPKRADRSGMTVLWASPERRSLAERADANSKLQDIPFRTRMIDVMGYSPEEVDRMEGEREADTLLAPPAAQPTQPVPTPEPIGAPA